MKNPKKRKARPSARRWRTWAKPSKKSSTKTSTSWPRSLILSHGEFGILCGLWAWNREPKTWGSKNRLPPWAKLLCIHF